MAVTTHRELDVGIVKTFLRSLREGRIYIARAVRSGRNGRYTYLLLPAELLNVLNLGSESRFRVSIGRDYVDYIIDERGDYKLTIHRGAQIRFPVDVPKGYVLIEPRPRGFRVYFA